MTIPELTEVESSNIAALAYDEDELTLWVRFKNGAIYLYSGIPAELGIGVFEAESVGRFFFSKIRPVYVGVRQELEADEE